MLHQGRKCNFKIFNVISVYHSVQRKIYNCKDKIQRWLKMIWRWPELNQSETDKLELKIWKEPSLSPVPWFEIAFHSLSTTSNNNQFKSELKNKFFEILKKEDDYIRIYDIGAQFSELWRCTVTPTIDYSPHFCLTSAINQLTNKLIASQFSFISFFFSLCTPRMALAVILESVLPSNDELSVSGSKPRSNVSSKICFTFISVLDPRSVKQLMASHNGEKYFSRACIKAR